MGAAGGGACLCIRQIGAWRRLGQQDAGEPRCGSPEGSGDSVKGSHLDIAILGCRRDETNDITYAPAFGESDCCGTDIDAYSRAES